MARIPSMDEGARSWLYGAAAVLAIISLALMPVAGNTARQIHARWSGFDGRLNDQTPALQTVPPLARDPFDGEPSANAAPPVERSQPPAAIVHAVIAGADARALVEEEGRMRIVQVGDTLQSKHVEAITSSGVRLEGGLLLPLQDRP